MRQRTYPVLELLRSLLLFQCFSSSSFGTQAELFTDAWKKVKRHEHHLPVSEVTQLYWKKVEQSMKIINQGRPGRIVEYQNARNKTSNIPKNKLKLV